MEIGRGYLTCLQMYFIVLAFSRWVGRIGDGVGLISLNLVVNSKFGILKGRYLVVVVA